MYVLKAGIRRDPVRRWALPDRIFFGYGACHILAGTYLSDPPSPASAANASSPHHGFAGAHVYVTDGVIAFDYQCRARAYLDRIDHAVAASRARMGAS